MVLFLIATIAGMGVVFQSIRPAYAANSLTGNGEIITIGGTTDGLPVNAQVYPIDYSADGNIIVFSSQATNLPSAGSRGLYAYNIQTGISSRVDVATDGTIPNSPANYAKVSETGRYVTFSSNANNLSSVAPYNPYDGMYIRDTQAGTTTYLGGGSVYGYNQNRDRNLGVSNDGRFRLIASRYIGGSYPYAFKIILTDTTSSGTSITALATGSGNEGSSSSTAVRGSLSCDGSFAIFQGHSNISLADIRKNATPTITTLTNSGSSPIISCNGRYLLYTTTERTITPTPAGLSNYTHHLVRHDRITNERMYINSNSSGTFSAGFSSNPQTEPYENVYNASISDTGDVVFKYNGNVYLKHLSDGSGTLESIGKTTTGSYINIQNGSITRDGRYVFMETEPFNLGLSTSPLGTQIIRVKTNL